MQMIVYCSTSVSKRAAAIGETNANAILDADWAPEFYAAFKGSDCIMIVGWTYDDFI